MNLSNDYFLLPFDKAIYKPWALDIFGFHQKVIGSWWWVIGGGGRRSRSSSSGGVGGGGCSNSNRGNR